MKLRRRIPAFGRTALDIKIIHCVRFEALAGWKTEFWGRFYRRAGVAELGAGQAAILVAVLHVRHSRQTYRVATQNFRDANEIVGCGCQHEEPLHQVTTAMSCLVQAADGLHPAERLFDPFALDRADAIAGIAGGARIET